MNRLLALSCAATLAMAALAVAATTKVWEQSSQSDLEAGKLRNVSLRSDGRLTLAPVFRELYDASANYLWAVVEDSKGNVYIGGSGQDSRSKLTRIAPGGQAQVVAELPGLEIHALAVDAADRIYAATSPDGKVYRLSPDGQLSDFYDPKSKYIWALAFDTRGNLIVATGDKGEVHSVTPAGQGSVLLKTEEAHARSLAVDKAGAIYVGTEPGGLVFRVTGAGQAFVLYQSPKREITALAVAENGALYAAAVGNKQAAPAAPALPPAPAPPAQPAPQRAQTPATPPPAPAPIPSLGATVQGGSDVIRIEADGYARKLWTHASEIVYSLAFDSARRLLIGTGNKGNIYRLDSDLLSTLLVNATPTQVTALAAGRQGKVLAVTGNIGKLFQLGPALEKSGTFESDVLDAGFFSYWGRLRASVRQGDVRVETRSGNLESPQQSWSPWSPVPLTAHAGRVPSPPARFLQYRVTLNASPGGDSPELSSVSVSYMPKNVAPVIEMIDLTPPNYRFPAPSVLTSSSNPSQSITLAALGRAPARSTSPATPAPEQPATSMSFAKGYVGVRWLARDDNGDALLTKIEIRGANETAFRLLRDDIRERQFSWDSNTMADGEYVLRLTVSDSPSNPPAAALSATLESDVFVIDNTPPRILNLTATRAEARWRAQDALNLIEKCEYSLDGGDWKIVEPTTRLTDSPEHDYVLKLENLAPGEHSLAVRVWDDYDNQIVEKITIR
jgi:outer membrane protein assembly factor BamB